MESIVDIFYRRYVDAFKGQKLREGALNDHHVVEVKLVFAIYFGTMKEAVFDHPHETVKLHELLLELRLSISH